MDTYIAKALDELKKKKSIIEIQVETALVWCGFACAAAQLGLQVDAVEYAHEAIEHAALSGNDGVLKYVRDLLTQFQVPV